MRVQTLADKGSPRVGTKGKPKPKKKHRARRIVYALVGIVVLFIVVNVTLFILGLNGISFQPAQSVGSNITITLNVPNDGFVPIDGRIVTNIYDANTGQLVGSSDSPFHLIPSRVSPVRITMAISGSPSDQLRVTMDYYLGAYGVVLPFPIRAADVTIPAP